MTEGYSRRAKYAELVQAVKHWTVMHQAMLLADLEGRRYWGTWVVQGKIPGYSMREWDLHGLDLTKANLTNGILRQVNFKRAILLEARLEATDLRTAQMQEAQLTGAQLSESILHHADLSQAVLVNAHLCKVRARNVRFAGANLAGADFSDADLAYAEFVGVTLSATTSFVGANLRSAKLGTLCLARANCTGADLTDALIRAGGTLPPGWAFGPQVESGYYLVVPAVVVRPILTLGSIQNGALHSRLLQRFVELVSAAGGVGDGVGLVDLRHVSDLADVYADAAVLLGQPVLHNGKPL